jgi:hypothetical protein
MTCLLMNTNDGRQMFRALSSFNPENSRRVLIVTGQEKEVSTYCLDSAAFAT